MKPEELTINYAQTNQPWTVPYSYGVWQAWDNLVPHILASHSVLHAAKSLGKLAAVFEELDHRNESIDKDQIEVIKNMSADLLTVALRFAHLYKFDLATELVKRVEEKNAINILNLEKHDAGT